MRGGPNCAKYCTSDLLPPPYILLQIVLYFLPRKNGRKNKNLKRRLQCKVSGNHQARQQTPVKVVQSLLSVAPVTDFLSLMERWHRVRWNGCTILTYLVRMSLASRWLSAPHRRYPWLRPAAAFLDSDYIGFLSRHSRSHTCHPMVLD